MDSERSTTGRRHGRRPARGGLDDVERLAFPLHDATEAFADAIARCAFDSGAAHERLAALLETEPTELVGAIQGSMSDRLLDGTHDIVTAGTWGFLLGLEIGHWIGSELEPAEESPRAD